MGRVGGSGGWGRGGGGLHFVVGDDCTGGGDIFQREGLSKFSAGGGGLPAHHPQ